MKRFLFVYSTGDEVSAVRLHEYGIYEDYYAAQIATQLNALLVGEYIKTNISGTWFIIVRTH